MVAFIINLPLQVDRVNRNMFKIKRLLIISSLLLITACTGKPEKVFPIQDFEISRYLGTWYEVARLDHSFERGLQKVTAEYSLREDGGIDVVNRGYSPEKDQWKKAKGKAYFVNNKNEGYLKVSFFGPFYGSYIIFELDKENYDYAFISGPDTDYLWLLSRKPNPPQKIIDRFTQLSMELGFDINELIFVSHK